MGRGLALRIEDSAGRGITMTVQDDVGKVYGGMAHSG